MPLRSQTRQAKRLSGEVAEVGEGMAHLRGRVFCTEVPSIVFIGLLTGRTRARRRAGLALQRITLLCIARDAASMVPASSGVAEECGKHVAAVPCGCGRGGGGPTAQTIKCFIRQMKFASSARDNCLRCPPLRLRVTHNEVNSVALCAHCRTCAHQMQTLTPTPPIHPAPAHKRVSESS